LDIEVLFESKGRFRVLRYLLREGQANISRIVRETGLPHRLVKKHLEQLVRHGIVVERRYGRLRLFEVNLEDPRISATKNLIRELEELWEGS
jgi:DNA-binding transcriptional ArsR family regulator